MNNKQASAELTRCEAWKKVSIGAVAGVIMTALLVGRASGAHNVAIKAEDMLQPITLKQTELGGEIGRRINDLIHKHYMAINLDSQFIEPFQLHPFTGGRHYIGVEKVIDAGSLFAAYTGDPTVAEPTTRLSDGIIKTRDDDGYIVTYKPEPEARQNHQNWALPEQEYLLLGLTRNWLVTGNEKSLQHAQKHRILSP
jgi:hypothetical protein